MPWITCAELVPLPEKLPAPTVGNKSAGQFWNALTCIFAVFTLIHIAKWVVLICLRMPMYRHRWTPLDTFLALSGRFGAVMDGQERFLLESLGEPYLLLAGQRVKMFGVCQE